MKLEGVEFLRRFLMHVLPGGFMRIRHFGFLANCVRQARVELLRQLLQSTGTLLRSVQAVNLLNSEGTACLCPSCHQKTLRSLQTILSLKQRRQLSG